MTFFGVEDQDVFEDIYLRSWKNWTLDEESKWLDLRANSK